MQARLNTDFHSFKKQPFLKMETVWLLADTLLYFLIYRVLYVKILYRWLSVLCRLPLWPVSAKRNKSYICFVKPREIFVAIDFKNFFYRKYLKFNKNKMTLIISVTRRCCSKELLCVFEYTIFGCWKIKIFQRVRLFWSVKCYKRYYISKILILFKCK